MQCFAGLCAAVIVAMSLAATSNWFCIESERLPAPCCQRASQLVKMVTLNFEATIARFFPQTSICEVAALVAILLRARQACRSQEGPVSLSCPCLFPKRLRLQEDLLERQCVRPSEKKVLLCRIASLLQSLKALLPRLRPSPGAT